jgi:hypothetical protein
MIDGIYELRSDKERKVERKQAEAIWRKLEALGVSRELIEQAHCSSSVGKTQCRATAFTHHGTEV